jgi:hypothetical protein
MKRTDDVWTFTCWTVSDDSTDSDSAEQDDDGSAQTCVMDHVEIRCYWVAHERSAPSAKRATATPADTDHHGWWVAERSVRSAPISASQRSKLAGAGADVLANTISNKVFPVVSDGWVVQDPGRAGAFSDLTDSAQDAMHQFVLGAPATEVCRALDAPRAALPVVDGVARELPLGIDDLFHTIKTVAQIAGMAIGVATGVPLVSTAAFKAFVHDQVTRVLTREFDEALIAPSGRERPMRAGPAKPKQHPAPVGRIQAPKQDRARARPRRRPQRPSQGDARPSRGEGGGRSLPPGRGRSR